LKSAPKLVAQVGIIIALAAALPAHAALPCLPGEIKLFAGNSLPSPWIEADGKLHPIAKYRALFRQIGANFGGDGTTTFAVPNLSDNAPLEHTSYLICTDENQFPSTDTTVLGEIVLFASAQPPPPWGLANGQLLPIDENNALFAIYGTVFGGDGVITFGLPNLSSKSPITGVNYVVALRGRFPLETVPSYVGETTILPGNMYPEITMRPADGQILRLNSNLLLFAVIGTYFGGNGVNDFALPNLTPHVPGLSMRFFITDRGEFPSEPR
jgi:microcystin-dependent protein